MSDLRDQVEAEARAAHAAVGALTDEGVARGSRAPSGADAIAAANAADVAAATGLDEGALDRLGSTRRGSPRSARSSRELAALPPLERAEDAWTLENGLRVAMRRIPIGAVGANFEARPNVAVDVAGQLLKSLNAAVLRTGGAALRTVTALVDDVLRPALAEAGLPPEAVGLVRSAEREGARVLVSLPQVLPLVILRGSGETTAALAREAAAARVRTLAHAEGGGVLYCTAGGPGEGAEALVEASLDRLGVCNRLNLLLVDRAAAGLLPRLLLELGSAGIDGPRAGAAVGHEWANDPEHVASVTVRVVDSLDEAVRIANDETSGLAAAIVDRGRRRRPSGSSTAIAARPRSGTRPRASPTASRSPAHRRPGSTSTACPGRAGR